MMKKIILLAGFLSLAGITHAQRGSSGAAMPTSAGGGGASGGLSTPHNSSPNSAPGPYSGPRANVSATNPGEFVPTTFQNYHEAVITAEKEQETKPLEVAEAARMTQAMKKSGTQQPALIAEQDDAGNVVISGPSRTRKNN
jgi:hypothetical protein